MAWGARVGVHVTARRIRCGEWVGQVDREACGTVDGRQDSSPRRPAGHPERCSPERPHVTYPHPPEGGPPPATLPGERWPLYLLGFLGRTVVDGGSPVKGGGIGVVLRRGPGVPDLLVEVRYRYDLWLPRRRLECWEFMVGIGVL